jgi:HD-GYP domain-containing protein (c-di-GMP phosphodiesterase class II)
MQKIMIGDVKTGDIIAKDIFNYDGVMLVPSGTSIKENAVKRLRESGIREVFVKPQDIRDNASDELQLSFKESVYCESIDAFTKLDDFIYQKTREQAQKYIKKTMFKVSTMNSLDFRKISALVGEIIEQLLEQKDIVLTLSKLRSVDDYTYEHSVNVCILSLIIGIDLNLNKASLINLGIGSMLHDIGKVGVSEDILKKPSRLTNYEFDEIKRHTDFGYQILKSSNIPEESAIIALCHHEKYDGTGYNAKMKGKDINTLARITAIADVYDAMSNDRVYKRKKQPDLVYREIIRLGDSHFDAEYLSLFMRHLCMYPVGTGVVLNTNHTGVVIKQNKFLPESPVIRVFKNNQVSLKVEYTDIDMSSTKYLYIKETF